jgi:hypothetical protein
MANRQHVVLKDETDYAVEWCIVLAWHIAEEERDRRAGKDVSGAQYYYLREPLWKRFENPERGFMSNGVARQKDVK